VRREHGSSRPEATNGRWHDEQPQTPWSDRSGRRRTADRGPDHRREETCDGDPEAAIRALVDRGIDIHVNIVGFALDDGALKATFRDRAGIGQSHYIDAGNAEELRRAVVDAVQPPLRVLDRAGKVVAEGLVGGDPVSVPAGTERVEVLTDPIRVIEPVAVQTGTEERVAPDGA